MLARFTAYWRSNASTLHAKVLLLTAPPVVAALHALGFPTRFTDALGAAAVLAGAFLFTPAAPSPEPAPVPFKTAA